MKPSERLNCNYTLARTSVDLALDDRVISAPATVTLQLAATPKVAISCTFTWAEVDAVNKISEMREVRIYLENGKQINTVLGDPTAIGDGKITLTLIPKDQPVTVKEESSTLARCKFALLNFPSVLGKNDITRQPYPEKPQSSFLYPRFQLQAGKWIVDVFAVDSLLSVHSSLVQRGGSALTHTGTVVRTDGHQFSLDELKPFLTILHQFLSFARGSYCGLTYISGHDFDRNRVWEQWGTYKVEPWQRELHTWLTPSGSHELSGVFEGFWKLFQVPDRGEAISKILQWHLRSNESNETEVGVVLAQAALEHLSFLVAGPKQNRLEGEWIADALDLCGISPDLPTECVELEALKIALQWNHAPHALVAIRNNLIHPDNRSGPFSQLALREAQELGLYFIELIILQLSGYKGTFSNRLKANLPISSRIEAVPWAANPTA